MSRLVERRVAVLVSLWFVSLSASLAHGHPGGTDRYGCHVESATGVRHCHGDEPAPLDLQFQARLGAQVIRMLNRDLGLSLAVYYGEPIVILGVSILWPEARGSGPAAGYATVGLGVGDLGASLDASAGLHYWLWSDVMFARLGAAVTLAADDVGIVSMEATLGVAF